MYIWTKAMTRSWRMHVILNVNAKEPYAYIQDR